MFLNLRNFTPAIILSFSIHVVIMAFYFSSVTGEAIFFLFVIVDILMMSIGLLPIVAIARHELDWFDPICFFALIFLLMTSTFFLAYMIDPGFVRYFSGLGSSPIGHLDVNTYLLLIIKAELVLMLFVGIVLFVNRYRMKIEPLAINRYETWAAFSTLLLLFIVIGIPSAYLLISSLPVTYLESITTEIGSSLVKEFASGQARYAIFADIGFISLSLGVAGFLATSSAKSWLKVLLLLFALITTILFQLVSGSRIAIVYTIAQYILIAFWFGYRIRRRLVIALGITGALIVASITLIRGNPYISNDPIQVIDQLFTGEAQSAYRYLSSSPAEPIMNPNRTFAVALVYDYLHSGERYLYGETMLAGPLNFLADFAGRLNLINEKNFVPFRWANEVILIWAFGGVVPIGTLPPSLPGEFFMQWGWPTLIIFSFLFAYLIRWLRTRLYLSKGLIARWVFLLITLRVIFIIPTEISGLTNYLLYYLIVIGVYIAFDMLYRVLLSRSFEVLQNPSS